MLAPTANFLAVNNSTQQPSSIGNVTYTDGGNSVEMRFQQQPSTTKGGHLGFGEELEEVFEDEASSGDENEQQADKSYEQIKHRLA